MSVNRNAVTVPAAIFVGHLLAVAIIVENLLAVGIIAGNLAPAFVAVDEAVVVGVLLAAVVGALLGGIVGIGYPGEGNTWTVVVVPL